MRKLINRLQEFSVPLIMGVICAVVMANFQPDLYDKIVHTPVHHVFGKADPVADSHGHSKGGSVDSADTHAALTHASPSIDHHDGHADEHADEHANEHASGHAGEHASHSIWEHILTMHFFVNDLFMVLFFGVAAKEITEACLPSGPLNPIRKAFNPLAATLGGVLGPVGAYLLFNAIAGEDQWAKGWGIPTATDIALAWLVARFVFGAGHAAVSYLLLLAVADDAIGLGIIAFAYPDPAHPVVWSNTAWIVPGMAAAYVLRMKKVGNWLPYIAIGGSMCWWGLYSAHLHPALALVFVVPFLPGPNMDLGLYVHDHSKPEEHHSPLESFEHDLKAVVDFGLFFFAFANAGVAFSQINNLTWIVLSSLVIGKTLGIVASAWLAERAGFPLPSGMNHRHTLLVGIIAGIGLTVALFVSGQAFTQPDITAAAKMGAVFSVVAAPLALMAAGIMGLGPLATMFSTVRINRRSTDTAVGSRRHMGGT